MRFHQLSDFANNPIKFRGCSFARIVLFGILSLHCGCTSRDCVAFSNEVSAPRCWPSAWRPVIGCLLLEHGYLERTVGCMLRGTQDRGMEVHWAAFSCSFATST